MHLKTTLSRFLLFCFFSGTLTVTAQVGFTENKGQITNQFRQPRTDILFGGSTGGLNYFLAEQGMHYQLAQLVSPEETTVNTGHRLPAKQLSLWRVDINWLNTNPSVRIVRGKDADGFSNFYPSVTGQKPALGVKTFESVRYSGIYEGVDLKFFIRNGILESDFIVRPYADYKQIEFEILGADLEITPRRELRIKTPFGDIIEGTLKVYQGERKIDASWVLNGNKVSFALGDYDPSQVLIIDPPVRIWGTYFGGNDFETCNAVATDHHKRSFIGGQTYSLNNIASSGAHQDTISLAPDAYISSFSEWGKRRWSTYFGGEAEDVVLALSAFPEGDLIAGGMTKSVDGIASLNAHQPYNADMGTFSDGFVARFDTTGSLQWSTYIGGSWIDEVTALETDDSLNIYIGGATQSADNIATENAFDDTYNGSNDAFLMKMTPSGDLLWGSYFGDANDENLSGLAVRNGKLAITGKTNSTAGIASFSAHQKVLKGAADSYLALFDLTANRLEWASYFGGPHFEEAGGIAIDSLSNIYISGSTYSTDGVTTNNAYQKTFGGGSSDAYLAKFSPWGELIWSTYFGGRGNDDVLFCKIDDKNSIYFGGSTGSSTGIATQNSFKSFKGDGDYQIHNDAFLAKFNDLGRVIWATYYGGREAERATSLALDTAGNIFLSGTTRSLGMIATETFSFQKQLSGSDDAFLVRFNNNNIPMPDPEPEQQDTVATSIIHFQATAGFCIYPNPASGFTNIKTENTSGYHLRILNLTGQIIQDINISYHQQEYQLNISELDNGIYFLNLQPAGELQFITIPLLIQH